ncbi:MAG TPA: EthD family reductase [Virgibacillus sp.]|nr:EthD family reductase [Virgibacillus sp.]HLR67206.1 EthD family reductase [Virgibacillus sp.]
MIVRMGILSKIEGLSMKEFKQHWIKIHGEIGSQLPNLKGYYQNHVTNSEQLGIEYKRGSNRVDGISQLWFDNEDEMKESFESEIGQKLKNDEQYFIEEVNVVTAIQNTVIPVSDEPLIKRMSILKRHPNVDVKKFREEWKEKHARLIKQMPYVKGYVQNIIVEDKQSTERKDAIDGIVELWFKNIEELEAAFGSPNGKEAMEHSGTFIEEITTYLVKDHVIVSRDD